MLENIGIVLIGIFAILFIIHYFSVMWKRNKKALEMQRDFEAHHAEVTSDIAKARARMSR